MATKTAPVAPLAGVRTGGASMLPWLGWAGLILLADQLTKLLILGAYRLGDELRFVFITSDIELIAGSALQASASASKHQKCERCWHYRADVGRTAEHPTLCGRCVSNLYGAGETRTIA